jgi:hypothetical protein
MILKSLNVGPDDVPGFLMKGCPSNFVPVLRHTSISPLNSHSTNSQRYYTKNLKIKYVLYNFILAVTSYLMEASSNCSSFKKCNNASIKDYRPIYILKTSSDLF